MTVRRLGRLERLGNDEGSVTIEAALALSSLVIVAAAVFGAIATLAAYISAVDTAGAAARAHAIGVEFQPPRDTMNVYVGEEGGVVRATVGVKTMVGTLHAEALFPAENVGSTQ